MKNTGSMNLIQAIIAVAKIIICLLLPMITFAFIGIPIPFIGLNGIRMLNMGMAIIYLPLLAYVFMLVFSLGSLQKISFIPALVALVGEIIFLASAAQIVQSGDLNTILSLIPESFQLVKDVALANLAKPGIGLVANLILTIVYAALQFLNIGSLSNGPTPAANRPVNLTGNAGGHNANNGNRPRL